MTIPSWFVIVMGLGTVFVGLICIILLCKILGAICSSTKKQTAQTPVSAPVAATAATFANRQEVIAAIAAVIAEDCGVETDAIRITSIRKI